MGVSEYYQINFSLNDSGDNPLFLLLSPYKKNIKQTDKLFLFTAFLRVSLIAHMVANQTNTVTQTIKDDYISKC